MQLTNEITKTTYYYEHISLIIIIVINSDSLNLTFSETIILKILRNVQKNIAINLWNISKLFHKEHAELEAANEIFDYFL